MYAKVYAKVKKLVCKRTSEFCMRKDRVAAALQRDKHSANEKSPVELLADVISLVNRAPLCPQKAKEITDAIHRLHSAHCLQYMNFHVQDEKELQLLFNDC
jgi:hypothetical protein